MDALGGSIGTIPPIKGPFGLPHFKRFMGFLLHRWYIVEKLRRLTHLLINNSKKRDSFGGSKRTPSNSSKEDEKICWFEEEGTWNFRVEFQVGDMVFLRIRPYRQVSLMKGRNEKLWPKFFGSYKVLERIGAVAYRLALLESAASISCLLTKEDDRRAYQSTSIDSLYIRKQWMMAIPDKVFGYQKNQITGNWEALISPERTTASWSNLGELWWISTIIS